MKLLLVLNDPPYGTERSYNGLRLAGALTKRADVELRVFLLGDSIGCAVSGQQLPDGYYHLDRMVGSVLRRGGEVGCCGSCLDARAVGEDRLIEGARRSTLEELAEWTLWADRVVTF